MSEREFFKAIAADALSGAYYLYGREPYSRGSAIRQCQEKRAEAARPLNVQTLSGAPAPEIINACETLPFFDEKRLVIVRELGGDDALLIADYAEKVPESTILLIERAEPVKNSALFKMLEALGRTIEFAPYDEDHAVAFLEKRARENELFSAELNGALIVQLEKISALKYAAGADPALAGRLCAEQAIVLLYGGTAQALSISPSLFPASPPAP